MLCCGCQPQGMHVCIGSGATDAGISHGFWQLSVAEQLPAVAGTRQCSSWRLTVAQQRQRQASAGTSRSFWQLPMALRVALWLVVRPPAEPSVLWCRREEGSLSYRGRKPGGLPGAGSLHQHTSPLAPPLPIP